MPQNGENAYSVIKNPRVSRALDPSLLGLTSCDFAVRSWQKGPKFSVWAPPLQKAGYGPAKGMNDATKLG